MIINLHIEKLVLDGLPLERRDGPLLQAAVQQELARLLANGNFTGSHMIAAARAPAITLTCASPQSAGRQIAAAVFEGIKT
jgi:hypothetical protein